ncbi:MAG: DUF2191 domain-containing protein [Verrucomicrobiae bacterium]|nr:DUF2191 domain-containing protein [Verrucomicrobiae bacterium]
MRTTLTLDDDLAEILALRARQNHKAFKEVVNEALRAGLATLSQPEVRMARKIKVRPFTGGLMPGVDPDRMNQLYDELEADSQLEKMRKERDSQP